MDYMTLEEAGERWGVSPRQINYYCVTGRIPGVVKVATIWLIPKIVEKSTDRCIKEGKTVTEQYNETDALWVWF